MLVPGHLRPPRPFISWSRASLRLQWQSHSSRSPAMLLFGRKEDLHGQHVVMTFLFPSTHFWVQFLHSQYPFDTLCKMIARCLSQGHKFSTFIIVPRSTFQEPSIDPQQTQLHHHPNGTMSASNIHVPMTQKLLHQIQYCFYVAQSLYDMIPPLYPVRQLSLALTGPSSSKSPVPTHTTPNVQPMPFFLRYVHFTGQQDTFPTMMESPFHARLHVISKLPLFGRTSGSLTIATPIVNVPSSFPLSLPGVPTLFAQCTTPPAHPPASFLPVLLMGLCRQISTSTKSPLYASLHAFCNLVHPHGNPCSSTMTTTIPLPGSSLMIDPPTITVTPFPLPLNGMHHFLDLISPPSLATIPFLAEVSQTVSKKLSALSPCQVHPQLVPFNHSTCFTWVLLSCNKFVSSWYGVRYHPGEHIQKHIPLNIHIWELCYFLTVSLGNSHSFLSKSLVNCWKRATGCILLRSPLWRATPWTMCPWQYPIASCSTLCPLL